MRTKLVLVLLIAVAVAGCIHDTPEEDPELDDEQNVDHPQPGENDVVADEDCQDDINDAQQASADADVCTDQFAEMQCPHDEDVTYGASDGCAISELEERGWEPVGDADAPDETDTGDDDSDPVRVAVGDNYFEHNGSDTIEAEPGQLIVFDHVGNSPHTVTIPERDVDKDISPGDEVEITIDEDGEYDLTCEIHDSHDGEIIIEG